MGIKLGVIGGAKTPRFDLGQTVKLKSGSPDLLITQRFSDVDEASSWSYICTWTNDEGEQQTAIFAEATLQSQMDIIEEILKANSLQESNTYTLLEFIYDRLINSHNENENYDYMHKLKQLRDILKREHNEYQRRQANN